jgi:hypothetical protein
MDWHYFIICSTLVNPPIGELLVKPYVQAALEMWDVRGPSEEEQLT